MLKILAIDPSGTGTTGVCLIQNKKISFQEFKSKDWKEHLDFIKGLVKKEKPALLIYENTHYIHQKTQDGLSLFRLLGALESLFVLTVLTEHILVHQVKDLKKQLFKGTKQIPHLTYQPGKGWFYQTKKLSLHQLDAFLVYWLWKEKNG